MEKPPEGDESGKEFILLHRDAVSEETWSEFRAAGVYWFSNEPSERELTHWLQHADIVYGVENVFTGDPFDLEQDRPRPDLPGTGIYIRAAESDHSGGG